jgi:hypothetical protein
VFTLISGRTFAAPRARPGLTEEKLSTSFSGWIGQVRLHFFLLSADSALPPPRSHIHLFATPRNRISARLKPFGGFWDGFLSVAIGPDLQ